MKQPGRLYGVVLVPALLILASVLQQGIVSPKPDAPRIPEAPAAVTPSLPSPPVPAPPVPANPTPATPVGPAAHPASAPVAPTRAGGPVAEIDGSLVDGVTGAPVQGAEVSLPEIGLKSRSSADGTFSLPIVPIRHKAYEVLTTCSGYASHTAVAKLKAGASKLTLPPIKLKPKGW